MIMKGFCGCFGGDAGVADENEKTVLVEEQLEQKLEEAKPGEVKAGGEEVNVEDNEFDDKDEGRVPAEDEEKKTLTISKNLSNRSSQKQLEALHTAIAQQSSGIPKSALLALAEVEKEEGTNTVFAAKSGENVTHKSAKKISDYSGVVPPAPPPPPPPALKATLSEPPAPPAPVKV